MSSRHETSISLDRSASPALSASSAAPSTAPTLTNAFSRIMATSRHPTPTSTISRDTCSFLEPQYNYNYNPLVPPSNTQPKGYSPYIFKEPLHDDREALLERFPPHYTLEGSSKRERTQWVWKLGYAVIQNGPTDKHSVTKWMCKRCHHDVEFSKNKQWIYKADTLKNAEKHLLTVHKLDSNGDIWRVRISDDLAQASGTVDGGYEKIIPFRQQEFKNAFLEWVICDNVKHRAAASTRLKRAFKIANMQALDAIPKSHATVASWIHEMHAHFEPTIIDEIKMAKSKISISFDGWGTKHEKLSVVGVVAHFVNSKYEVVSRLLGLPAPAGHGKRGVG